MNQQAGTVVARGIWFLVETLFAGRSELAMLSARMFCASVSVESYYERRRRIRSDGAVSAVQVFLAGSPAFYGN